MPGCPVYGDVRSSIRSSVRSSVRSLPHYIYLYLFVSGVWNLPDNDVLAWLQQSMLCCCLHTGRLLAPTPPACLSGFWVLSSGFWLSGYLAIWLSGLAIWLSGVWLSGYLMSSLHRVWGLGIRGRLVFPWRIIKGESRIPTGCPPSTKFWGFCFMGSGGFYKG